MTQEQYNSAILNLLIGIKAEILTLRYFIITSALKEKVHDKDRRKKVKDFYDKMNKEHLKEAQAKVIAHYTGFDVDDFLDKLL